MARQTIKENLEKILSGELKINYVLVFRKHLIKSGLISYKCKKCNLDEWLGKKLVLDLDHIDGDKTNNSLENLRFLCPNCHSQTDTFRAKNIISFKKKAKSDIEILNEIKKGGNTSQILKRLDLDCSGGNYYRIKQILRKIGSVV